MADGVSVEQDGQWVVRLNGIKYYSAASFFEASAFSTGFKLGLESRVSIGKESDLVADTVRALDEEQDEPAQDSVDLLPGDRVDVVSNDSSFIGYVEERTTRGSFWVRIPFLEGDARMLYRRDELTFLGRNPGEADEVMGGGPGADEGRDEQPLPFKVGDRIVDEEGDRGTVVQVFPDCIDVQFDNPDFGLVVGCDPEGYRLLASRPSVTPHPDRPETADGEVPENWREDCMGNLYVPGGGEVAYVPDRRWWYAGGGHLCGPGPKYFTLRSEAIARLQELLAEGGE